MVYEFSKNVCNFQFGFVIKKILIYFLFLYVFCVFYGFFFLCRMFFVVFFEVFCGFSLLVVESIVRSEFFVGVVVWNVEIWLISNLIYIGICLQVDCCVDWGGIFFFLEVNGIGLGYGLFYEVYVMLLEFFRDFVKVDYVF